MFARVSRVKMPESQRRQHQVAQGVEQAGQLAGHQAVEDVEAGQEVGEREDALAERPAQLVL